MELLNISFSLEQIVPLKGDFAFSLLWKCEVKLTLKKKEKRECLLWQGLVAHTHTEAAEQPELLKGETAFASCCLLGQNPFSKPYIPYSTLLRFDVSTRFRLLRMEMRVFFARYVGKGQIFFLYAICGQTFLPVSSSSSGIRRKNSALEKSG